MENLTKATCSRCGGSGRYSFNLTRGTVCFKCNGAGFVMVNLKNEARNTRAKELRDSLARERMAMMSAAYHEVVKQMNAIHHIENVDTALGIQTLDYAVIKATGRSIAQHRDELISGRAQ
jgi:hypothetical protein